MTRARSFGLLIWLPKSRRLHEFLYFTSDCHSAEAAQSHVPFDYRRLWGDVPGPRVVGPAGQMRCQKSVFLV
jgi:hypothetical protein